ncbi:MULTISPECIES: TIM barrel protein [unclassified Actinomyces]|uniref:sugar phosphate isomerase/epimerase family protein n=1 Tax=unclassified Actinomyces TaxID=2609248 RepID=UPI002016DA44|nr:MULTISPECIES: TIM barrel protein [unclassified Actinomyces]MCL3778278.1 TIM barrel protein [Actinomyces sp. AC-20-1]MCL3788740.1 TIM barrel protein [Actinomyces sp. 187325]MCL3792855.1 TIM barrel protein [Actinomyces sp. 186855]MCL3794370.1 TIM barrel protein [Actinomyces sp. 217892]
MTATTTRTTPVLGVQMMMLKDQVAEQGMYAVLERLAALDLHAVEVSQIPMTEANVADLERARGELGIEVAALSTGLRHQEGRDLHTLDEDFDTLVAHCRRLGCRFLRIGMMDFSAMVSKEATEAWAAEANGYASRLKVEGITLCYHNHHVDLHKFDGERIFDIVRRVAPDLHFEVDLHWVQRGGMAPLDMLAQYAGVCRLIHVKDYRVTELPAEALELMEQGRFLEGYEKFVNIIEFAEVGAGNMNWPALLPAAAEAGAEFYLIEQDLTYGRDPFDCIRDSREYLRSIGY